MHNFLKTNIWISIVCVIAIITGICSAAVVGVQKYTDSKKKTRYEQLIERDGFLHGINYPWLGEGLGHNLSKNNLLTYDDAYKTASIDSYGTENIYRDYINLKALGFNVVAVWGSSLGEGIIYGEDGSILGINDDYLDNIKKYMDEVVRADMDVLWYVNIHATAIPEFTAKEKWDVYSQMICNPQVTEQYIKYFVKPVLKVLKEYSNHIALISPYAEDENEISDANLEWNLTGERASYGVSYEHMRHYISRVIETIREDLPEVDCTVASNGTQKFSSMYNDFDIKVLGENHYGSNGTIPTVDTYHSTHPMIVTEYGMGMKMEDDLYTLKTMKFMDNIEEAGFLGSLFYCYNTMSVASQSEFAFFNTVTPDADDFRNLAYTMHYHILDYRYKHAGIENTVDKPSMLYYNGGSVKWLASRQAEKIDIQRSENDGKTWTTIVKQGDPSDYQIDYLGKYIDETAKVGVSLQYRVIAYDSEGKAYPSDPTDKGTIQPPPPNLVENGTFENGTLDGWKKLYDSNKAVVSDDFAHSGEKSMYITGGAYTHIGTTIKVDKNKKYILTYWYKRHPDDKGTFIYQAVRSNVYGDDIAKSFCNRGEKGEWVQNNVTFNSENNESMYIGFYMDDNGLGRFYLDDIEVKEAK